MAKATVKIQNGVVKVSQQCHIFLYGMFKQQNVQMM